MLMVLDHGDERDPPDLDQCGQQQARLREKNFILVYVTKIFISAARVIFSYLNDHRAVLLHLYDSILERVSSQHIHGAGML
jgi:hypothetical protein